MAAVRPVRLRRAGVAGPVGDHGGILDHYPQMSGQTRIACGFLGAAVLRDTQRWLSQRQARALRRQQGDRPGRPPAPARERSWSREQDMELTRKLAARLREEAAMAEAGGAEGQD